MGKKDWMNCEAPESAASMSRRRFLSLSAGVAGGLLVAPSHAIGASSRHGERILRFRHLHTGESLTRTYWAEGVYLDDELADINRLLRDHRTGDIHQIDPQLLDLLHHLQHKTGSRAPFEVISGYRSPKTNEGLRKHSNGVAKKSLHMRGMAIDIRIPGVDLARLRKAALALKGGGVGYYPKSNFLHIDTGRVRHWS
jgi:uncharacterized protein YcbK (DUF882 family)